jgi:hypothetical protein
VSDSPAMHSRWLLLLKIDISSIVQGTIHARFGLIRFSGFRGEDLNVIWYQNMLNLYNRYKSAERKISMQLKFELILVYTKAAMDIYPAILK